MKKLVLLLFLILTINASAQDKKIVTKNANGSIQEIGFITSDGKKDSTWVRYNNDGTIISTAQFSNGLKNGIWLTFNDNGVKLFEIVYVNGYKKYGKHWDENGVLIEEREFN